MNEQFTDSQNHTHFSARKTAGKICLASFFIVIGGLFITSISQEIVGYKHLPNKGRVIVKNGEKEFLSYYPYFRKFAIMDKESPQPLGEEDNELKQIGFFGRGLFFYSVANAPHWIMEMEFSNLRAIAFIPIISLLIGCVILFMKFLPTTYWTHEYALRFSIAISVLHSLILVAILIAAGMLSNTFYGLYQEPHFYKGEFFGTFIPGLLIMIVANLFYGAVIGGVLPSVIPFCREIARMFFPNAKKRQAES